MEETSEQYGYRFHNLLPKIGKEDKIMNNKYKADFATVQSNRTVEQIGKSIMLHPEVKHTGRGIKWFDDEKLRKKKYGRII